MILRTQSVASSEPLIELLGGRYAVPPLHPTSPLTLGSVTVSPLPISRAWVSVPHAVINVNEARARHIVGEDCTLDASTTARNVVADQPSVNGWTVQVCKGCQASLRSIETGPAPRTQIKRNRKQY